MPKFRKIPTIVEAVQFFESEKMPDGVRIDHTGRYYVVTIHEQRCYVLDGDWILPEPKPGRYYPVKPEIFAATYEAV